VKTIIESLAKTLLLVPILAVVACAQMQNPSDKAMVVYGFASPNLLALIDETSLTITATVPYGTDATGLVATFAATGQSVRVGGVEQVSGTTPNDFTNPVAYTVTAADGSAQDYTVTVSVAAADAKAITMFGFPALSVTGMIHENNRTITATVPLGTDVARLVASFTTTGTSVTVRGVAQVSGTTVNDFTLPVTYTVTAADGSTRDYAVTVSATPTDAKAITMFGFPPLSVIGMINESSSTITATVPFGTDVAHLAASFATTGTSVTVGGVAQVSGTTVNDFTGPVTYTVTASDASTRDYAVTVSVAAMNAKAITAFGFPAVGVTGAMNENNHTIAATVPFGTNVAALIASFTTTGTGVTVNGVTQASGVTVNDFTIPVTYIVTAEDGSTRPYVVTVSIGTSTTLTHTWTEYLKTGVEGTDFPEARSYHGLAYAGGDKMVMLGGWTGGTNDYGFADFWKYDLGAHAWTKLILSGVEAVDYPYRRFGHGMTYAGGSKIVVFGGAYYDSGYHAIGETWEWDSLSATWTQYSKGGTAGTDKPEALYFHAMCYMGGTKVLLFGGLWGSTSVGETWVYDTDTHQWTQYNADGVAGTDKPEARHFTALSYLGNGKALLFGGYTLGTTYGDTWIYDLSNHAWTEITTSVDNPEAPYMHSMAYAGGTKAVLFGGYGPTGQEHKTWVYDITSNEWTEYNKTGTEQTDFPCERHEHKFAGDGAGRMLLFGGADIASNRSDTWEYR
jgi:hypothetical protein